MMTLVGTDKIFPKVRKVSVPGGSYSCSNCRSPVSGDIVVMGDTVLCMSCAEVVTVPPFLPFRGYDAKCASCSADVTEGFASTSTDAHFCKTCHDEIEDDRAKSEHNRSGSDASGTPERDELGG